MYPDAICATLHTDGYAVVRELFDASVVDVARREIGALVETSPYGRDDFEGRRTRRVYALFAKTRALDPLATHPTVLAVLDATLDHYQLSAPAAIDVGAGEGAQPLHPDDAIYPVARPHSELVVTVMCPFTRFTRANGATRVVPRGVLEDDA